VVGLEDDGSAASVVVTQRIVISRKGDFSFTIPAPATSVVPGPGTQAQPGLRDIGIVWQGFSAGRRVLAATATLSLTEAESGLPLSVSVRPKGGDTVVTLANIACPSPTCPARRRSQRCRQPSSSSETSSARPARAPSLGSWT
jgi:hypothetical protein